ncbi:MAG: hypothetical protein ACI8RE_002615, partial [Ilumatobacter sp.]
QASKNVLAAADARTGGSRQHRSMASVDKIALTAHRATWVARVAWIVVAVFGGAALQGAVEGRSEAVRWTTGVGGWAPWGAVMLALAIPSVRSLTIARVLAPLAVPVAIGVVVGGAEAIQVAALAIPAGLALFAIFTADVGRQFVQASSYGDEERLPLRFPVAAGSAAIVTWALWAPIIVFGPLLLAAKEYVFGGLLSVIGAASLGLLLPRWHRFSRRWLVLVPAGLVVHDPIVLADTLMVRSDQLGGMRLAPADTEAADLTGPASGYAIEVQALETVTTVLAFTPQDPGGKALHLTGFLISPSRPGKALATAAARGIPLL